MGHVGEGFTFAERGLGLVDEDGVAAEGVDAGLEAEAGTEGSLLEEEHHLFGIESVAEVFGVVLDGVRELHDGGHLLYGEIGDGAEIAAAETLGGFAEGSVGLDAESGCRLGWCVVVAGELWLCAHHYGFATHGIAL